MWERERERESTRCRDIEAGGASVYATRARWRVDWCSCSDSGDDTGGNSEEKGFESEVERSKSKSREECDGAGDMGNTVVGGTRTGNVVVVVGFCWGVGEEGVMGWVEDVGGSEVSI
jgi:hypothetical protein